MRAGGDELEGELGAPSSASRGSGEELSGGGAREAGDVREGELGRPSSTVEGFGDGPFEGGVREAGSEPEGWLGRPSSSSDGAAQWEQPSSSADGSMVAESASWADDDALPARPFWSRTSSLVVLVVALLVLSGAVTAWLRISDLREQVSSLEEQAFAAEDARRAAVRLAADLATYDYRDLGGNFRFVSANCTTHFSGQLRQLASELGPQLQASRAVAKATIRSAGVVRADMSTAVVVVFVDQAVTNTTTPEPRTERSRMELTLVKQGGAWRLDQAGEL